MGSYKEKKLYTMSNKPITMLQIRRILQQRLNGKSNREIAKELHISRDAVNEYVKQLTLLDKTTEELLKLND
jgi:DNA-binding NarL/FixJ family response regulator